MSLIIHLKGQVDNAIRKRGWQYYQQKRVRIGTGDAWQVSASVQGSSLYDVSLDRDEDALVMRCDCPYFQGNVEACKHVWATLLAADQRGYLQGDGTNNGIFLDVDDEATLVDDFEDGEDNLEEGLPPVVHKALQTLRRKAPKLGLL